MLIPDGLTEDEVLLIMEKAANEKCHDYLFGVNSPEDIKQQAIMHCIRTLNNGKFVPRDNGKSIATQLLNFLRVHIRNKLSNDLRNSSFRYANPENKNNNSKYAIQHPVKIYSQGLEHSEIFGFETNISDGIDREGMIKKIREQLSIPLTKDFLKWMNGVKLSETRQSALFERIIDILNDEYYDHAV